ncbi:hypothetical protein BGW80DRAFT_1487974 [Lactifluus volemus]|nr:hypothetical protein BGW80DRAFT_1487974 [Lactifluus volemus]
MRSFKLLSGLSLLLGSRASHLAARHPIPHALDVRQDSNVCSFINVQLVGGGFTVPLDSCFCTDDIPSIVHKAAELKPIIPAFGGEDKLVEFLDSEIIAASALCSYPPHSISSCLGSPNAVCGFECANGFVSDSPSGFPSTIPPDKKKRWVGSGVCAEMGPEWAACGVFGGRDRAWECINTANNLESCGGCALPLTPFTPIGQDCSSLPGVADVACIMGECAVRRCLPGYVPAHDGTHCISKHRKISHSSGDEHIPLPDAIAASTADVSVAGAAGTANAGVAGAAGTAGTAIAEPPGTVDATAEVISAADAAANTRVNSKSVLLYLPFTLQAASAAAGAAGTAVAEPPGTAEATAEVIIAADATANTASAAASAAGTAVAEPPGTAEATAEVISAADATANTASAAAGIAGTAVAEPPCRAGATAEVIIAADTAANTASAAAGAAGTAVAEPPGTAEATAEVIIAADATANTASTAADAAGTAVAEPPGTAEATAEVIIPADATANTASAATGAAGTAIAEFPGTAEATAEVISAADATANTASTAASATGTAVAEPPGSAVAEPPGSAVAEPPGSAVAEPPGSAVAEPPGSAVAEPPGSAGKNSGVLTEGS